MFVSLQKVRGIDVNEAEQEDNDLILIWRVRETFSISERVTEEEKGTRQTNDSKILKATQ